jgi:hypothetical protein
VRLAKSFVREKLNKKVQFLQPNNDDMMKKVYTMAWKYMNYNAHDFFPCGPRLYCQLSKVTQTCCGADMWWQSRIESFAVKLYILLDVHRLAID